LPSIVEVTAKLAQQRRLESDASHEIRTPLTSLTSNLELLERIERLDRQRDEQQRSRCAPSDDDRPARRQSHR